MDHQYRENGERDIYSNYNQMRAYIECSPNQSKCWPFLYLNSTRAVLEFSSIPVHVYKMVITTACVQIDNCFCNT